MSALWPQLVSTALVGTGRRSPETIAVPQDLAPLVPGVPRTESDLLAAAGALTLARRAGLAAVAGIERPAALRGSDLPPAPPAARSRLRHLLDGTVDVSLVELWLRLATERGLGVSGRDLPNLFRLGRAHERLRTAIVTVAGPRGAWLADQNSDWSWVLTRHVPNLDVDDEQSWFEGLLPERVAYAATARRRDPARGRDLIASVWAQEPPAERAALLSVLGTGLGIEDEPLLESALDDRRKEVRAAAAGLLAVLPDSAYAQRMTARARACVIRDGDRIVVTPPAECDAAMRRDGIEPKPPAGTGERAWWFEQIVISAPLSAWTHLGASPAVLAVADDWAPTLHRGWAVATARIGDAAWASALLASDGFDAALWRLVPPETAVAAALRLLESPDTTAAQVTAIVGICPAPWPRPLVGALLDRLRAELRACTSPYVPPQLRELGIAVVNGLPPHAHAEVAALAASLSDAAAPATTFLDALVTIATTRYQILQEFA